MNATQQYSLGILAGGQGRRWGGRDKGLVIHLGEPLVARMCLPRPQQSERLICCTHHPHFYQHFADRVLCDSQPGQGPCAGIVALLTASTTESMIILPVDLIGAPENVIETLEREWRDTDSAIVLYSETQRHSPCIRLRRSALDTCQAYIDEDGRRLLELYALLDARQVIVPTQWLSDADTPEALKQS